MMNCKYATNTTTAWVNSSKPSASMTSDPHNEAHTVNLTLILTKSQLGREAASSLSGTHSSCFSHTPKISSSLYHIYVYLHFKLSENSQFCWSARSTASVFESYHTDNFASTLLGRKNDTETIDTGRAADKLDIVIPVGPGEGSGDGDS